MSLVLLVMIALHPNKYIDTCDAEGYPICLEGYELPLNAKIKRFEAQLFFKEG